MHLEGILGLGAVILLFGAIIALLTTLRTDPPGYESIGSFSRLEDADRAAAVLEHAGIAVMRDDHLRHYAVRGTGGVMRLLVRSEQREHALRLLLAARKATPSPPEHLGGT